MRAAQANIEYITSWMNMKPAAEGNLMRRLPYRHVSRCCREHKDGKGIDMKLRGAGCIGESRRMANAYMIEVFGEAAGIVVSERRGFRFYRGRTGASGLWRSRAPADAAPSRKPPAYELVRRHDGGAGTEAEGRGQQGKRR